LEVKEVSMSSRRYTAEFKAEAVKQVTERGYSVREVSERLGVSVKSLYLWIRAARGDNHTRASAEVDEMRRENTRLKAELRRVEEERDILKKAAAYFAKASG
jgi:transposase